MHDVNTRVEFTTQSNHQLDRFVLSRPWPRLKKRLILTRRSLVVLDWTRQLRVHDQERIESREFGHRFTQMLLSHMLKLINTRRNQETLEPNHARLKHRLEFSRVPRHDAA